MYTKRLAAKTKVLNSTKSVGLYRGRADFLVEEGAREVAGYSNIGGRDERDDSGVMELLEYSASIFGCIKE